MGAVGKTFLYMFCVCFSTLSLKYITLNIEDLAADKCLALKENCRLQFVSHGYCILLGESVSHTIQAPLLVNL